jgi:hypothetical protein
MPLMWLRGRTREGEKERWSRKQRHTSDDRDPQRSRVGVQRPLQIRVPVIHPYVICAISSRSRWSIPLFSIPSSVSSVRYYVGWKRLSSPHRCSLVVGVCCRVWTKETRQPAQGPSPELNSQRRSPALMPVCESAKASERRGQQNGPMSRCVNPHCHDQAWRGVGRSAVSALALSSGL